MTPIHSYGARLGRSTTPAADFYIIAALSIAALYYGQGLFIPLSLAMLLAFALTPVVARLNRFGASKAVSSILTLLLLLGSLGLIGSIIATQAVSLIEDLPKHERTLREKIQSVRALGAPSGSMGRAGDTLKKLHDELEGTAQPPSGTTSQQAPSRVEPSLSSGNNNTNSTPPIAVKIVETPESVLQRALSALNFAGSPLATAAIVLLFLVFILVERESLRDRLIRLLGNDDVERSTTALNETAGRLSKYLSALLLLNLSFGVVVAVGLWFIGVPAAALWGVFAALMRFVPFVGSFIAALFPLLLAASVDPGWTMVLLTLALFLITEPLMGHVIEPVVQGKVTGLSMLAILVATAFWTLLWGPIGLILAVPLTLVLVSFGKHLEPLAMFSFVLGDDPPLSPAEKFYQRVLSGDAEDAVAQAEEHLETMALADYYDTVVGEALRQAAVDFERGRFDAGKLAAFKDSMVEVVELLSETDDDQITEAVNEHPEVDVVCIGARTMFDDAGAHIMQHILTEQGISARAVEPHNWTGANALRPRVVLMISFATQPRLAYISRSSARVSRSAERVLLQWGSTGPAAASTDENHAGSKSTTTTVPSFRAAVAALRRPPNPSQATPSTGAQAGNGNNKASVDAA